MFVAAVACGVIATRHQAAVVQAAQTQTPAPQVPAPPPAPNETQPPIFRSGVKLVLVDVSVTGNDDEPIADLTPEDFELTEDGVPQTVAQATLVRIDGAARGNGETLAIRSQDHAIAEAGRDDVRVFAVFMDDYHLGRYPQEMLPLRKALTDFLGPMMGPLDLVTVMNPITPLSALKWTRDRDTLARELRAYEGRIDNFVGRSALEESQNLTRNVMRVRSQVVVSALQALVMHLSGLREGRKTLLVVSRGIPLQFDISLEPEFQALLREANRGNVIIHTLDPRGLGQGVFVHDTLFRLSSETGGQAIVNTNDLSRGLSRVIRDASHHYLIGYAPTRELNDGKFHKLAVKVKRRGAKTVARKGYWSPTAEEMTPVVMPEMEPAVSGALTALQSRQDARVAHVATGFAPGPNGAVRLTATWRAVPGVKDRPERLRIEARTDAGATLGAAEDTLGPAGTACRASRRVTRDRARALQRGGAGWQCRRPLGGAGDGARPYGRNPGRGHARVRAGAHHGRVPGAPPRRHRGAQSRPRVSHDRPGRRAHGRGRRAGRRGSRGHGRSADPRGQGARRPASPPHRRPSPDRSSAPVTRAR